MNNRLEWQTTTSKRISKYRIDSQVLTHNVHNMMSLIAVLSFDVGIEVVLAT